MCMCVCLCSVWVCVYGYVNVYVYWYVYVYVVCVSYLQKDRHSGIKNGSHLAKVYQFKVKNHLKIIYFKSIFKKVAAATSPQKILMQAT